MAKSYSEALEGIFTPETTVRSLLDNVRETLVSKYTDLEAAEKLAAQVEAENGDILKIILNIANTMAEVHNGAATKEDAMATVTPMVKTIKEKCVTLGLTDAFAPDNDISEVELDMLKQFITECRTLVEEHINALRDAEGSDLAGRAADLAHGADTEETEGEEAPEDDVEGAEESVLKLMMSGQTEALEGMFTNKNMQLLQTPEYKKGNMLMKQAKSLYKTNPQQGLSTMKQASASFKKALQQAKSMGTKTEMTDVRVVNPINYESGKIKRTLYDGVLGAVSILEDKIDTCDAYLLQWSNKAGKKDLDELKKSLKAERKAERDRFREELKAQRAAKKEQRAADKAAKKEAKAEQKAAKKAAREAAKSGDVATATEALIALVSYATEGTYIPDPDNDDAVAMEASIVVDCLSDEDYLASLEV